MALVACFVPSAVAHAAIEVDQTSQVYAVGRSGEVHRVTHRHDGHYTPVWSPDGRRFATTTASTIEVSGRSGKILHRFRARAVAQWQAISWSPDGRRLAFIAYHRKPGRRRDFEKRLVTAALDGSRRRVLARRHIAGTPAWSPDGRTIYYERSAGAFGSLWRVGSRGGTPRLVTAGGRSVSLSPDGRRLLFIRFTRGTELVVARPDGSRERTVVQEPFGGPWGWAPGRAGIFLFQGDTGHLRVRSPSGGWRLPGAVLPIREHLVWSSDGRRVAWTAGGYASAVAVRSCRTDGTDRRTLASFTSKSLFTEIDGLSWSPGRRILVAVHEHWGD